MHKTYIAALAALVLGCLAASAAPVDNCGFEKVPRDALLNLHEARGKQFSAGAVFVNGKYLPPPYVVSRYGTAIVINGCQVTGQVIPWSRFLGPRPGAAAAPESTPAAVSTAPEGKVEEAKSLDDLFSDDSVAPAPAPAPEPAPAPAPVAAADDSDDLDSSIDDLFGDEGDKPKPKPRQRATVARAPRPAAPAVPAGPPPKYVPSARTRQLQETIDKQRTLIDRSLRSNQFYFFSPRYASVGGNMRILGTLVETLPDALKDSTSADDLYARMRRAGLGFVSMEVCTDLYANKITFPSLYELRTRVREEVKRQKALRADESY